MAAYCCGTLRSCGSILGSMRCGLKVILEDGVAELPDRRAFNESVATTDRLGRNMIQLTGVSLLHAVQMMSFTPSEICKISQRKGTLTAGENADVIIFGEQITILTTIINE